MFQRLLGKKSSGGALLPLFLAGAKVATPGPRRHSTTAAFASSNPSSPTAASFLKQPLGVTLESAALQETLAKLNGVEANLGVPKGVSPINSFSARGAPLKERPRLQDFSETNHSALRSPTPEDDDYLLGHSSPPSENADDDASLTLLQFTLAACIPVVDALGMRIPFAELINVPSASVVFIRHWNCPSSQSYIRDVIQKVPRGRRIIIVGNGSHSVIPKYRKACLIPDFIEVYTEPSLRIHRALGLRLASEKEINKSEIKKNSSLAKAVVRALKSTAHYGPLAQLGGEFHFKGDGNSLVCTYAHRMENTKDHGPIHAFVPPLTLPFTLNNRNSNDSGSSADRSTSASPDIVPPITQLPSFITI
ncbi:hypothetical protein DL96DRAFT_1455838 [Flagelloscypha sp. PMI_526]|nr:hypothetical protein DL96DRAFT_1455838 [Flagelloscypha sp. PMI_526]